MDPFKAKGTTHYIINRFHSQFRSSTMSSSLHLSINSRASILSRRRRSSPIVRLRLNGILLLRGNRLGGIWLRWNSLALWRDIQVSLPVTSAIMHTFAEDTRGAPGIVYAGLGFVLALEEDVFEVESVDVAGEESEDREADVD